MAFIRINRKLFENSLWKENRIYSKAEAWIDLIQLMSYSKDPKQREKFINGVLVKWNRGQYPVSYSFLSQRWNWSVHKVRIFIELLKREEQVATLTTSVATILTLCNYETYNPISQAEEQADVQADGKRTAGSKESIKKEEESIKPNRENLIFLDKVIQTYSEEHGDYKILNPKKEREYAGMILQEYKSNNPNSDEDKTLADLRIIFNGCININDQWKKNNMCIRYIANNYNVLKQYFKNGNNGGKQTGASQEELTRLIAKHFDINT